MCNVGNIVKYNFKSKNVDHVVYYKYLSNLVLTNHIGLYDWLTGNAHYRGINVHTGKRKTGFHVNEVADGD